DGGLDEGAGAALSASRHLRLPHAPQPAGIPQRHAAHRDRRPSRVSGPPEAPGLVALAGHGEPAHHRIRQISDRAAAHRHPWPRRQHGARRQLMAFLGSLLFNITFYLWTTFILVLGLPALLLPYGAIYGVGRLWVRGTLLLLRYLIGLTHRAVGLENTHRG